MKRLIRSFALAALVAGCASAETVARPPAPPVDWTPVARPEVVAGPPRATARERGAADAYAAALSGPSFDKLGALLDEDAHFSFAGMRDAHGREKVVAAHEALFSAFDERRVSPGRVWLTDASQIVEWTMTGVQARDWMGVTAARRPVVIKGLTLLWTRDDGSVKDVHVIFDEEVVRVQLGAGHKELAGLVPPTVASGRQEFEQARTPEEASNVAAARAALDALEEGKEAAYAAAFTDDVEVNTPERAQPWRGVGDMHAYFKTLRGQLAELDTAVDNAFGVGPYVVLEYDVVGTQRGPIGWIPMQHEKLLKFSVADVIEMRAGKIARVWRYEDPAQVVGQP